MSERPIIFSARYDVSQHNAKRVIHLPDGEIAAAYHAGETIKEIAARFGVSRPTIAKSLSRSRVTRRAAKQRIGVMSGDRNPAWKGGRHQRVDGYWVLRVDGADRLEHRVVMERAIGRALRADEFVHHRDGDRSNNDPSNLELMTQSDHVRHHAPEMRAARYERG